MKTFGLGKQSGLNTFGLGGIYDIVVQLWKDALQFSVGIVRRAMHKVEY